MVPQREVFEHQGAAGPEREEEAREDEGHHAGHHRSGRPKVNVDEADGVNGRHTIQNFASSGTLGILVDLMTIVGMLGIMFWLDWDFALIAIAATPFLLLFVARFNRAVKKATHEVRKHQAEIVSVVQEGLESVRVVKAYGRQDREEENLSAVSHATVDSALKARKIKAVLSPVVAIVAAICTGVVLWRGTALVLSGVMTIGSLTVFLTYLSKFFKPVQDLAKMGSTIAQTAVAIERVQTLLDTDTVIPERADARDPGTLKGGIEFEHVAFAYDPKAPVLKDVHTKVAPGQFVGIVGPTGGGKSTIVSMIPRFYDPTDGRVLIDGVDLRDFTVQGLRGQIGFVLQDTVLFRGTVHDNIAYGRPSATDEEIVAGGEARERGRVHREDARRLPHHGGRARADALRRPAPADRDRARDHPQRVDPHPGRADCRPGHRVGEAGDGGPPAADEGADRAHDRAPPVHDPRRAQDPRPQGRRGRRGRHARRARRPERRLRRAVPRPGRGGRGAGAKQ